MFKMIHQRFDDFQAEEFLVKSLIHSDQIDDWRLIFSSETSDSNFDG